MKDNHCYVYITENAAKKLNVPHNLVVSVTMWDLPGQEEIDLRRTYYKNVDAIIGNGLIIVKCVTKIMGHEAIFITIIIGMRPFLFTVV